MCTERYWIQNPYSRQRIENSIMSFVGEIILKFLVIGFQAYSQHLIFLDMLADQKHHQIK